MARRSYNHYNLLASLEQAFGLGCLQNACAANPMTPLFQVTGSTSVPALPAPLIPPPNGNNSISSTGSANNGAGENDLFGAATAADGSTYAVGWYIDSSSGNHLTLIEHGVNGQWSIDPSPSPGTGDTGFSAVTAIPGGGLWAVGVTSGSGNFSTLIAHHC